MTDEAKRIVADGTWFFDGDDVSIRPGYKLCEIVYVEGDRDEARARIAACAPEALRMLMSVGQDGRCIVCGEFKELDEHTPDCPWLAIMRKAGLR